LELRNRPSALPHLIDFARSATEAKLGVAALEATEKMATPDDLEQLLSIVSDAQHDAVRFAAVRTLKVIIKNAPDKSSFAAPIISSFRSTTEGKAREQLLQILGTAGGSRAAELISTHLNGSNMKLQLAAIAGLREWPDTGQFKTLSTFVENEEQGMMAELAKAQKARDQMKELAEAQEARDQEHERSSLDERKRKVDELSEQIRELQKKLTPRKQGFAAMIQFLTMGQDLNEDDLSRFWSDTATLALSESEQLRVVNAMLTQKGEWALKILDRFMQRGLTDRVTARAEDGKELLKKRLADGSNDE
ncbi:MAG: hypothetical protein P8H96_11190, partial [Akkermansiaceae bacterium]|nr:hypothetical protein [Akkermansiaceae bacterium]